MSSSLGTRIAALADSSMRVCERDYNGFQKEVMRVASKQKTYRCPLCKKLLTKEEFDSAVHVHEAQQDQLKELERRLLDQHRAMPKKLKAAKEEGRNSEKASTARMVRGLKDKASRSRERVETTEDKARATGKRHNTAKRGLGGRSKADDAAP